MLTETITLRSGDRFATIDSETLVCTSLTSGDWPVLGADGMRVLFPWVGRHVAQAARLQVAAQTVAIEGGGADGLAVAGWRLLNSDTGGLNAELRPRGG